MKGNFSLRLFCLILVIFSINSKKSEAPEVFKNYYFLQKLYPGTDSISSLRSLKNNMKLHYFTLNKRMLFYSKNALDMTIKDNIILSKIVNKKLDNLRQGKCCHNLSFVNFNTPRSSRFLKNVINTNPLTMDIFNANYCLEIVIPNEARWRLCSDQAKQISKLQLQIEYNILLSTTGKKDTSIISKFLLNSKTTEKPKSMEFKWEDQQKWGYNCRNTYMQSPISIVKEKTLPNQSPQFAINYSFLDTYVKIEKRYNESIIKFINNPGAINIINGNTNVMYIPKYISFRFPGEHIILGKRFSGEMLIHCSEVQPDKKRRISNGLIITIPLDNDKSNPNLNTLESLNMDHWRSFLGKSNEYLPKDFKTEQQNVFEFSNIMFIIRKDKPNYYFYLGSNTTPPCKENVYHLVINSPLKISNCQFKILRENTLFSKSSKVIHSRLDQPTNHRKVYLISSKYFTFNPNVENYINKDFNHNGMRINGKPLLPEKLSTISKLKAIRNVKKLIKKGGKMTKKLKYNKKGVIAIRNGLNIKKIAIKKFGSKLSGRRNKGNKGSQGKRYRDSLSYEELRKSSKNIIERGVSSGEYGLTHNNEAMKEELNC